MSSDKIIEIDIESDNEEEEEILDETKNNVEIEVEDSSDEMEGESGEDNPVLISEFTEEKKSVNVKRKLTEDEMYEITDFLIIDAEKDWETAVEVMNNIRNDIHKQLESIEIYPNKIPKLKAKIESAFHQSQIDPGQSVGVDAALAIGEPTTQLCTFKDEKVIVRSGSKIINSTVGEFIDQIIKDSWMTIEDEGSSIAPTDESNWEILSVSKNEALSWSKITEVSRHPPHGDLIKVTTASGRENISTLSHSFLKRTKEGEVVPIKGSDLIKGDRIPVCRKIKQFENPIKEIDGPKGKITLTKEFGEFIGIFIAEGSTCRSNNNVSISSVVEYYKKIAYSFFEIFNNKIKIEKTTKSILGSKKKYLGVDTTISCSHLSKWLRKNVGTYSQNKKIPAFVFGCEKWFIACVLRCMFDGDGNINPNRKSIKYHSTSKDLIEQTALLLSYFGIFCSYHIDREAKTSKYIDDEGDEKESKQLDLWVILIYGPVNGKIFREEIGTNIPEKMDAMLEFTVDFDPLATKEELDQIPFVADLISKVGRGLKLPGASRNYGRWVSKEQNGCCIGRKTLTKYVELFEEEDNGDFTDDIALLRQAVDSDVVWDRIVSLEIIKPDPSEFVYDFSVANNETFTLQSGITVHNTLNTFHLAGVGSANVTLGVPRLNEILNASKNQKTNILQVKLLEPSIDLQETRDTCRCIFEEKYVDQSIDSNEIVYQQYNNLSKDDALWYMGFDMFYNTYYRECNWSIRLKINKLTMYQYKLTTAKIAARIEKEYKDCRCVFSPDNIAIVDVYIDTSNVDSPSVILANKKKIRKTKKDEDADEEKKKKANPLITDENKDYFFVKGVALDYLMDIKLSGTEGINKVYYRQDPKSKEWIIQTAGTNMRDVMNHPDVDFKHVVSNNMWEIFGILGIEAARYFLIGEITTIISFGGTFVDPVHPTLLADSMTSTGTISSVNRYGIGKGVAGVLTSASFEQSHQTMLDAPIKGMKDDLSTVSAAIIMGKRMPNGTGYFDLQTDWKKLGKVKFSKSNEEYTDFGDTIDITEGIKGMNISSKSDKDEEKGIPIKITSSSYVFKNKGRGDVVEHKQSTLLSDKVGEKAFKKFERREEKVEEPEYIDF